MKIDPISYVISGDETASPLIRSEQTSLSLPKLRHAHIKPLFGESKGLSLKMFGAASTKEPHAIAVQRPVPMHTDKKHARYTHQLIVYTDDGFLHGMDGRKHPLRAGMFFVLDRHSPHCITSPAKGVRYYVAASIDANKPLSNDAQTISTLADYANNRLLSDMEMFISNDKKIFT